MCSEEVTLSHDEGYMGHQRAHGDRKETRIRISLNLEVHQEGNKLAHEVLMTNTIAHNVNLYRISNSYHHQWYLV